MTDSILDALEERAKSLTLDAKVTFSSRMMRASIDAQREVLLWIKALESRERMSIKQSDAVVLRWVHACYLHVASLPTFSTSGTLPMATVMAASNLLR